MNFVQFATETLKLELTPAWRVLLAVCIDGVQPRDLEGTDRELARTLFGDVDEIPAIARRILLWILGRESWKTTISAAIAIHAMLTADLSKTGPGDQPTFMVIAPDRKTAGVAIRIALGLARQTPSIARLIESETGEGFTLRRPQDRKVVAFESFAVSRAGANLRGRSILGAILDESMFFTSDAEGDYVKNDRDVYRAIVPRLMRDGRIIFISTPWPVETLTGELFALNHGHPITAIAARASTLTMRDNDPELAERIDGERAADPENTARERDADMTATSGAGFMFDGAAIDQSIDSRLVHPVPPLPGIAVAAAMDLAFRSDAAALAIVGRIDGGFALLHGEELRPQGEPLKPTDVLVRFATVMARYGLRWAVADQHAIDPVRELLASDRVRAVTGGRPIQLEEAPAGASGKLETHLRARTIIHGGDFIMPPHPVAASQLKAIRARPAPGGGMSIWSPRRKGSHGDLASAIVLALCAVDEMPDPRKAGDPPIAVFGGPRAILDFGAPQGRITLGQKTEAQLIAVHGRDPRRGPNPYDW